MMDEEVAEPLRSACVVKSWKCRIGTENAVKSSAVVEFACRSRRKLSLAFCYRNTDAGE